MLLAPLSAAFVLIFYTVTSLWKSGLCCSEFSMWTTVFRTRLIAGWLKDSILKLSVRKGVSFGDAPRTRFCGVFWMREIVEFFKISLILLIHFGLQFSTQLLDGVLITPNTSVITAFLWFLTIGRSLFTSFSWGGSPQPLPLCCLLLLSSIQLSVFYIQKKNIIKYDAKNSDNFFARDQNEHNW